ncbi:MAG: hypothetical protein ABSC25_13460 [Roseiarcus sp.]
MTDRNVIWLNAPRGEKAAKRPQAFSTFDQTPNLILLGDPGAGKTHLFQEASGTSNGIYLTARSFLNTPQFAAGAALFIDALDERRAGRGDQDTIDRVVQKLFAVAPGKVRISCRAQDWLGDTDLSALDVYFKVHGGVAVVALEALSGDEQLAVLLTKGISEAEATSILEEAERRGLREFTLNPQNLIMLAQAVMDGQWPSTRTELFELSSKLLLSEENKVRMRTGAGVFSADELRETAGALCAVRLVGDVAGIGLQEGDGGPDFPSYRSLTFLAPDKALAALQRRAFVAGPIQETVDYAHRTTAEYLGAGWIAQQVRDGLPIGRVRALIGVEGHPASELRGLHAWLAVLLPEFASGLIEADPYGVLTYADAASLSPLLRKHLLAAMGRLSERDPWFRRGNWESPALGMLARPDMVDAFRDVLRPGTANFGLRSVVVDAIALGEPLPELLPDMALVLEREQSPYVERLGAARALERLGKPGTDVLAAFSRAPGRNTTSSLRLRSHILTRLYGSHFSATDVASLLADVLALNGDLAGVGALWSLERAIPCADIPSVLDAMRPMTRAENDELKRRNLWEVASTVERLIIRYLQEGEGAISGAQIWPWLRFRRSLRSDSPTTFGKEIPTELSKRPGLLPGIAEASFAAIAAGTNHYSFHRELQSATLGAIQDEALSRWIVDYLPRAGRGSEKERILYELAVWLCMREAAWCVERFEELTTMAEGRPDLAEVRAQYLSVEIPDWQRSHTASQVAKAARLEKDLVAARIKFASDLDAVRTGKDRDRLTWAARIYCGDYLDSDLSLPPVERLRQTLGEENAAAARQGFVAMLGRPDFPSLDDVVALAAQHQVYDW